ncbi:histidinol-phosphate transaminase [Anoxybacter fermentans]|uniref:Histidinol-phosphate aminotransferase n=1 Tax=Anoxybacter fermentans TaxID=1323375 RepID=A0A3Q9HRM2_9FIRM|nr:histidinol-phosphate transaminase [Anoxybacter fermentans]AZR74185.1 histidinol-phosphate transaminase [Anoxybacter fermentans]
MSLMRKVRQNVRELGRYQPGKPIEEVKRKYQVDNIIKMASNENPLGPSPLVLKLLREGLQGIHQYPDSNCYYLKQALCRFYNLEEENLIIGNGSDEIIDLIMAVLVEPGDEVIYANPSFIKYRLAVQAAGGKSVEIPLRKDFTHDLKKMANAVTRKTRVIFICNPNNPTGTIVGQGEILDFLSQIPTDILVVIDQAYREYVTDPTYCDGLNLIHKYPNLLLLRTFSKIYGLAGLRVGYGIGHPEIIDMLNRVRSPFNVNLLAQKAAIFALQDQNHVLTSRYVNEQGKKYLYQNLDKVGLDYIPTQGNFMLINTGCDAQEIFEKLLMRGIIIRPGNIFGLPTWIRITIGTENANKRFISALIEILPERRKKVNDCGYETK